MAEVRRYFLSPCWRSIAKRRLPQLMILLAGCTLVFGLLGFINQYRRTLEIEAKEASDEQKSKAGLSDADQAQAGQAKRNHETKKAKPKSKPKQDLSIPIFKAFQIFLLNSGAEDDANHPSNWPLFIARLSAVGLFLAVSFVVILNVADDAYMVHGHRNRTGHVVICGLGQIGLQLFNDLRERIGGKNIVVIESYPANYWIEHVLSHGATVVIGDSTKLETLKDARTEHAHEVFVVNGDDGVNLEVTAELGALLDNQPKRAALNLYVHIVDTNFATTLRPYSSILQGSEQLLVHVFNVPRTAASRLVVHQLWQHAPKEKDEVAHFVILGFGPMGQALAVELAQLGHFPNRKRSRFTIADKQVKDLAAAFLARFSRFTPWNEQQLGVKGFSTAADDWSFNSLPLPEGIQVDGQNAIQYVCNAEFVNLPAGRTDELFARKLLNSFEKNVKPIIFVCGQQDRENFDTAVQLREQFKNYGQPAIPIFVWLPRQPALARTLSKSGGFFPFGECEISASYNEITTPMREALGKKIHEDYHKKTRTSPPNYVPEPWQESGDLFRESNRVAADHAVIKLAALNLQLKEPHSREPDAQPLVDEMSSDELMLAEMEHYRWVAERLLTGWRYSPAGPDKVDIDAKKKLRLNRTITTWKHLEPKEQALDLNQVRLVLRVCQTDFGVEPLRPPAPKQG
jgi:hypothetical protein